MLNITSQPETTAGVDVLRLHYTSNADGIKDWALIREGKRTDVCIVALHGHGSDGCQIFTRPDIREMWFDQYEQWGLTVLSPNLRGNAWMCPEAVIDLHALIEWVREKYSIEHFLFISGSMGGTGNLIYSIKHPEDVTAVTALCPVTDIASYYGWRSELFGAENDEILKAIHTAYQGSPVDQPAKYASNSVLGQAEKLTMPILIIHAEGDAVIPIEQARNLKDKLDGKTDFKYFEIPDGDHDTPLRSMYLLEWIEKQLDTL